MHFIPTVGHVYRVSTRARWRVCSRRRRRVAIISCSLRTASLPSPHIGGRGGEARPPPSRSDSGSPGRPSSNRPSSRRRRPYRRRRAPRRDQSSHFHIPRCSSIAHRGSSTHSLARSNWMPEQPSPGTAFPSSHSSPGRDDLLRHPQ